MSYSIEDKYKFLISCLKIINIDYLENDADLIMEEYFQFESNEVYDKDLIVESIMLDKGIK